MRVSLGNCIKYLVATSSVNFFHMSLLMKSTFYTSKNLHLSPSENGPKQRMLRIQRHSCGCGVNLTLFCFICQMSKNEMLIYRFTPYSLLTCDWRKSYSAAMFLKGVGNSNSVSEKCEKLMEGMSKFPVMPIIDSHHLSVRPMLFS